jgi:1-pyrroline-5-carboxylate dehydrogenase
MNGKEFMKIQDTKEDELKEFIDSLNSCPRSGLHNPFKNVERYRKYGAISAAAAAAMKTPEIKDFFIKLIQRVAPKSYVQAEAEVSVTQQFLGKFLKS